MSDDPKIYEFDKVKSQVKKRRERQGAYVNNASQKPQKEASGIRLWHWLQVILFLLVLGYAFRTCAGG